MNSQSVAMLRLVIALLCAAACVATPADVASLVISQIAKNQAAFFKWDYCGAIVFDGIWESAREFPSMSGLPTPPATVTKFSTTLIFLLMERLEMGFNSGLNTSQDDLVIALRVANKYILGWPRHLADGSISRNSGWPGQQGTNTFIWGDDQYMGLALIARLAVALNRLDFARFVATQALLLGGHLKGSDGVYAHGYNDANHQQSCCKWGRANGWAMISHIESLQCLSHFPELQQEEKQLQDMFSQHAQALIRWQSGDGRWHQVINDTSTFLETSCTTMFISSMARGYLGGWLPASVLPSIDQAWKGLQNAIAADGTVTGICEGTGIQTNVAGYEARSTDYLKSGPGLGSVLYALVDYSRLQAARRQ